MCATDQGLQNSQNWTSILHGVLAAHVAHIANRYGAHLKLSIQQTFCSPLWTVQFGYFYLDCSEDLGPVGRTSPIRLYHSFSILGLAKSFETCIWNQNVLMYRARWPPPHSGLSVWWKSTGCSIDIHILFSSRKTRARLKAFSPCALHDEQTSTNTHPAINKHSR